MERKIKFGVYRNLENQRLGLPDDSPMAAEAHVRRGEALHEIFDDDPNVVVRDWGNTDDERSHEYVELLLEFVKPDTIQHVAMPAIHWLGERLANLAIDAAIVEGLKYVFAKVRPKMKSGRIEQVVLFLPDRDGTTVFMTSADGGSISVSNKAGLPDTFRESDVDLDLGNP